MLKKYSAYAIHPKNHHVLFHFNIPLITRVIITLDVKAPFKFDNTVQGGMSLAEKEVGVARRSHVAAATCHATFVCKVSYITGCAF